MAPAVARSGSITDLGEFITLRVAQSLEIGAGQGPYDFASILNVSFRATEFKELYVSLNQGRSLFYSDAGEFKQGGADGIIDLITMGMLEGMLLTIREAYSLAGS